MLHEQRHRQYRQNILTPDTAPPASAAAWLAVFGRLRGTGSFDLEQVPRSPSLHVVQSGAGWLTTDGGREEPLAAGDVFCLVPGERVRYREDPRHSWSYTWFGFEGSTARQLLAEAGFAGNLRIRRGIAGPALWRLCDEIEATFAATGGSPFYAPAAAYRIAAALAPFDASPTLADPAATLRLIIDAGYDSDLSVGAAADRLRVDRSTLFRRFRNAYGCSPRTYLRQVRLERARDLLRRPGSTVLAVAATCGYADHRAFARAYRERFGLNPSQEARKQ